MLAVAFVALSVALLAKWSSPSGCTSAAVAATALTLVNALIGVLLLVHLEYYKSCGPSLTLEAYLLLTSVLSSAQVRILWLRGDVTAEAGLMFGIFALRIALLVFEEWSNRAVVHLKQFPADHEATSGLVGILTF
jgi:hypothetical protein